MKRIVIVLMVMAFLAGCEKKDEAQQVAQPDAQATKAPAQKPQSPPMRPSDAWIRVSSPTVAAGARGSFTVSYEGVEPAKAMVLPLNVPAGVTIDSVAFGGSMIDYLANKPVKIDNDNNLVLIGAVPVTEPKIPAESGLIATVHFTLSDDAKTGKIVDGFAPPANYLSYVDTTNGLVQPYFQEGTITVK